MSYLPLVSSLNFLDGFTFHYCPPWFSKFSPSILFPFLLLFLIILFRFLSHSSYWYFCIFRFYFHSRYQTLRLYITFLFWILLFLLILSPTIFFYLGHLIIWFLSYSFCIFFRIWIICSCNISFSSSIILSIAFLNSYITSSYLIITYNTIISSRRAIKFLDLNFLCIPISPLFCPLKKLGTKSNLKRLKPSRYRENL